MPSKIEWTEETWNPVTGCQAVSPGCAHCWAARMTRRLAGMPATAERYGGLLDSAGHFNGVVKLHPDLLDVPLRRPKPTTYFVCSMADLFGEGVPFEFIGQVFAVMALCPQHTFQVLTKRPERMAEYADIIDRKGGCVFLRPNLAMEHRMSDAQIDALHRGHLYPLKHVWLGTSAENQETFDARRPHLLRCPAAVRFLSLEPLLGPIDLGGTAGIHWVIVGGESGPGARPMHPGWVRSIRDQCVAAGVPFFFKQWGAWVPREEVDQETWDGAGRYVLVSPDGDTSYSDDGDITEHLNDNEWSAAMTRLSKQVAGRSMDGREWEELPAPAPWPATGLNGECSF